MPTGGPAFTGLKASGWQQHGKEVASL